MKDGPKIKETILLIAGILFIAAGGHWNAYGHEIAAKAIVETLINNKIIDKKYLKEPK